MRMTPERQMEIEAGAWEDDAARAIAELLAELDAERTTVRLFSVRIPELENGAAELRGNVADLRKTITEAIDLVENAKSRMRDELLEEWDAVMQHVLGASVGLRELPGHVSAPPWVGPLFARVTTMITEVEEKERAVAEGLRRELETLREAATELVEAPPLHDAKDAAHRKLRAALAKAGR